jgi:cyclic pyranopterin phosphate synthase
MRAPLADTFARPLHDLRVSVTDRCNMRCSYCMPREVFGRDFAFMPASELLAFEEIARLCTVFARLGVRKVRLTGGEPLLRRQLTRLVEMVSAVDGISEIALTTNGTLLEGTAARLRAAGLTRVTVSLDALDGTAFRSMSDSRIPLARVLAGIDAASAAGLRPVKINMVVRRGVNDHCIEAMAEHFRGRNEILRFIEYMDVGETNGWRLDEVLSGAEVLERIERRWPLEAVAPTRPGEVARRYRYRDGGGEVGVITSVSEPFCGGCTRARLSADGRLYTCLFASHGHDLRALLRSGASDEDIYARIRTIWTSRSDRYSAERSAAMAAPPERSPKVEMSYIGG